MAMTGSEFLEAARLAKEELRRTGRRTGPAYCADGPRPLVWYDQVFARELVPAGDVECPGALRVGATQNGLDVVLVASHANEGNLTVDAGTGITMVLSESDSATGTFEEVGPSVCVTAPDGGLSIEPDALVARFALGNMKKPWCKVKLNFNGAVSGGTLDVALAYTPR